MKSEPGALHPWQKCLDIEAMPAAHYLGFVNEPLLGALDGTPRRVLELGCAGGALGAALKERHPGVHVTGIEAGREAAAEAARRLDRVVCARIEDADLSAPGFEPGSFDAVIAGDILEHLVNPWAALHRLRPLLAPGAQLVASIPNVRNLQVVAPLLLEGRWTYAERGLLDVTHLRFFTFAEMQDLLRQTGFDLEGYSYILSPGLVALHRQMTEGKSGTLTLGRMTLTGVTPREAMEFCAEQFLVRARLAA